MGSSRFVPAPAYTGAPEVCELLERVADWQHAHGLIPDGLIGPLTWEKRDDELAVLADRLVSALHRAGLHQNYRWAFLLRVMTFETVGEEVTDMPRLGQ